MAKKQNNGMEILPGLKGYNVGGRKCRHYGRTFSEGRELVRPYSRLTRRVEGEFMAT